MSVQSLKRRAPKRGDIIEIDFTPSAGREMRERHPALVVSRSEYNAKFRFVTVLEITTVGRVAHDNGFAVNLMVCPTRTKGVVVCDKPRSLDIDARPWRLVEPCPADVLDEAVAIACQVMGVEI